jgi:hypothetical protein
LQGNLEKDLRKHSFEKLLELLSQELGLKASAMGHQLKGYSELDVDFRSWLAAMLLP